MNTPFAKLRLQQTPLKLIPLIPKCMCSWRFAKTNATMKLSALFTSVLQSVFENFNSFCLILSHDNNCQSITGVLHLLPQNSIFCAQSQNSQHLLENNVYIKLVNKLFTELKDGIWKLETSCCKLWFKTVNMLFRSMP